MRSTRSALCTWLRVAVALAVAAPAFAQSTQEIFISTGRERGSYWFIGDRLGTAMLVKHKTLVQSVPSRGSLENLQRLADPESPVSLALAQADALASFLVSKPDFANEFIVLADVGKECALVVANAKGPLTSAADLKTTPNIEISVDTPHSGAAITLRQMTVVAPDFANAKPVYVDVMEALLQIKVASPHSKLRALMIVQRPSQVSQPLEVVLDDAETYRFLGLRESDVGNLTLPDGSFVYSYEKVAAGGRGRARAAEVETLCTRGLLLASTAKLPREQRSSLSTLMLESADEIIGKRD